MNCVVLYCVVFLCVIAQSGEFNFRKKLNNAVSKAKDLYKSKFGKDKSWHFLGQDVSEYPGTDKEKRKIQTDKWNEYYECLRKQENNIGKHGSIVPEAVLALEGESIKFQCRVCISPAEQEDSELAEWEWAHTASMYLEPIDYGPQILLSPEDKTLHIYNLGIDHSGQYICKLGKQLTAPYFLTVTNSSTLKMVHPDTAANGPYMEIPWKIHPQIMLDTMWGAWSPCSNCGVVGKRHKYGYCIIISLNDLEENETIAEDHRSETLFNITDASSNTTDDIKYIDMVNDSVKLTKIDMEILHVFKYGIPCHAHILPAAFKAIPQIQNRENEIMIGYCKVHYCSSRIL